MPAPRLTTPVTSQRALAVASKKHWAEISRDLEQVYHCPSAEAAETELEEFAAKWENQYPAMVGLSRRSSRSSLHFWTSRSRSAS